MYWWIAENKKKGYIQFVVVVVSDRDKLISADGEDDGKEKNFENFFIKCNESESLRTRGFQNSEGS